MVEVEAGRGRGVGQIKNVGQLEQRNARLCVSTVQYNFIVCHTYYQKEHHQILLSHFIFHY